MKVVQLDNGYWCLRRFNWKLLRFEYCEFMGNSHKHWWRIASPCIDHCQYETRKDLVNAMESNKSQSVNIELSEPTQSIIKAIQNRPDDFLFSKTYMFGIDITRYVVDKKTRLKLTKDDSYHGVFRSNNKNINFTEHEYDAIEDALIELYRERQKVIEYKKKREEVKARQSLTMKFMEYEQ